MKKPVIFIAVAVAAVAAFFVIRSLQSDPKDSGDAPFIVAFENDVVSLDPIRIADVFSFRVVSQIYEGLARLDENNEVVAGVAESWSYSPDLKTWTFKLRPGVKFHPHPALDESARTLTAQDVVYSFTRMLSKDAVTTGPLGSVLEGVEAYQSGESKEVSGIKILSDREVQFTLSRPDAQFLGRISSPAYGIVKQAVVEKADTAFGQSVAVGTGAYRFIERRGNDLVLKRNDQYWAGHEGPENVIFRSIKEDTVRLAELRAGRIDAAYATPPMLDGLAERDGHSVKVNKANSSALSAISFPTFNTTFLGFNWPRVDPDLREAIFHAVDRQQIVDAVVPLSGIAAPDPIPVASAGYVSKVTATRDLEKAKAAVARFRERNPGKPASLRIQAHELAQAVPISEVLQSQLREAGIEVEIVQQSFNAVVGLLQKKDYDAVVIWFEYMYAKPELMLETYFTTGAMPIPNVFQYSKPENDEAIAALFSIADPAASIEQAALVSKNLVEDVPGVFLFQTSQVVLHKPNVTNLRFNASNLPILTGVSRK
jgi:ABC-type transport system substrate-binding protein